MIKKLVLSFSLVAILFFVSCTVINTGYDNIATEDLTKYVHTIKTDVSTFLPPNYEINRTITSTSWHIGNGYIVTCAHCVVFNYEFQWTPFGIFKVPVKSYNYKYTMDGNEIDLIGTYDDVALLYNNNLIGTPEVTFGDSDLLKPGDKLIDVGNSMMQGVNIKSGCVSKIKINKAILEMHERTAEATMVISVPVNGGDSGSPLFATKDGKHYVVGMVYAGAPSLQGYNMAFKSNYILDSIEKILIAAETYDVR